jgi:RHS repeat-associated protein
LYRIKPNISAAFGSLDYYPFGSVMQGRAYSNGAYRFGFNAQERDAEMNESYSFEYRIQDSRLGRFLSIDPLKSDYPWNSPFSFAENRVVDGIDLEGLEFYQKIDPSDGKFYWYYSKPQRGEKGCSTCPWSAKGQPFAIGIKSIHTVNYQVNAKKEFIPQMVLTPWVVQPRSSPLTVNTQRTLNNGGSITLAKFEKQENEKMSYGVMSGIKIQVQYKSSNPQVEGIYYLQSIPGTAGKNTYDASSDNNPFYYANELGGKRNFEDNPGFNGKFHKETVQTFTAALVVYEKIGDQYNAVGVIEYSFHVEFMPDGTGKVTNVKQSFTDLTIKK